MEVRGFVWEVRAFQSFDIFMILSNCIAEDFALMEASYAIIRILQAFPNIRLPPEVPNEPVGAERQKYTISLAPMDGVKVLLT